MEVDSVDVSGSDLKYLESNFAIYTDSITSLKTDNFECDCINDWMTAAEFVEGYDCEKSEIEGKCPPRAVQDGYQFNFYEDSSDTAIVSTSQFFKQCQTGERLFLTGLFSVSSLDQKS